MTEKIRKNPYYLKRNKKGPNFCDRLEFEKSMGCMFKGEGEGRFAIERVGIVKRLHS